MQINNYVYNLNVRQAAELLGYHPQTVRDLARQGQLPALKRRFAWYFSRQELTDKMVKDSQTYVQGSALKHDLHPKQKRKASSKRT